MDLYCVAFEVSPLLHHPLFFEWTNGVLNIWLFAESCEEAGVCAFGIVRLLPYKMEDNDARVALASELKLKGPDFDDGVQQKAAEQLARKVGLALLLWHDEFGTHKKSFLSTGDWPAP